MYFNQASQLGTLRQVHCCVTVFKIVYTGYKHVSIVDALLNICEGYYFDRCLKAQVCKIVENVRPKMLIKYLGGKRTWISGGYIRLKRT